MDVPDEHPRKASLDVRHRLVEGFEKGLVAEAGLIAHGRGEAFDYLLGEATCRPAVAAIEAAAALLVLAKHPVISVNGNTASLCPREIVDVARVLEAEIEVNLFYYSKFRAEKIRDHLMQHGADKVYGLNRIHRIPGLKSQRGVVDEGLFRADVVLVMLEDGDRTEMMKKYGKRLVCVDLNPLSRSAKAANITVVDNVVRCLPLIGQAAAQLKSLDRKVLKGILEGFSQQDNLSRMESLLREG